MTELNHRELIADCVEHLYAYVAAVSDATHNCNRPGIVLPRLEGIRTASCGAYREWGIFAVCDRLAFAADGYRVRSDRRYGGTLYVVTGDGHVVFPPNDSCSYHSLALRVSGGELVNVSRESGPWTSRLPGIAQQLCEAAESVKAAILEYDQRKQTDREQSRQRQLSAAHATFSESEAGTP